MFMYVRRASCIISSPQLRFVFFSATSRLIIIPLKNIKRRTPKNNHRIKNFSNKNSFRCSLHWPNDSWCALIIHSALRQSKIAKCTHRTSMAHRKYHTLRAEQLKNVCGGRWSWIDSGKRKQKADKVNEQRSHINRTFKLINRRMHFMVPVWCDAIRAIACTEQHRVWTGWQ